MIVKTLELDIYISESNSLKDKRRVLKSLINRCRQKFNVSVSELEDMDKIRHTVIGIATVTNADSYADEILDRCLNLIETEYSVEIVKIERERN